MSELNKKVGNVEKLEILTEIFMRKPPLDLSDPKVYLEFCRSHNRAIRPEIEASDGMRLMSKARSYTRVILGYP